MLTGYFIACANDSNVKNYLYRESLEHNMWNKLRQKWIKKQQNYD